MNKALVCGAGRFIGSHMVKRLKQEGYWVRGVDWKFPEFSPTEADDFAIGDLRDQHFCASIVDTHFKEVFLFAADMGGAGFVFTGENDADIMHNSALINLDLLEACYKRNIKRIFYSSSACIYPEYNQLEPDNPNCAEDSVYPAAPDSEYGWEKLFSERRRRAGDQGDAHGSEPRRDPGRVHEPEGRARCVDRGGRCTRRHAGRVPRTPGARAVTRGDHPGAALRAPRGAFYVFPDVTRLMAAKGLPDSVALSTALLREKAIAFVPGEAFGAPGHIRISYATSRDTIRQGMERLREYAS